MTPDGPLPARPPFTFRARILTPLARGGSRWEPDGLLDVDQRGRIAWVGPASDRPEAASGATDLRPWLVLPGLVDLHAHLPQLPNAGLGAGLELLRLSLRDMHSPWASLIDAVTATLPALRGEERDAVRRLAAEGPPEEEVGLAPFANPQFSPGAAPEKTLLPMPSFPGVRA